jgi:hypothetical protein
MHARSLAPALSWEAFPRPADFDAEPDRAEVSGVSYRVRVFDGDQIQSMLYERSGLAEAKHQIEQPLLECHEYTWTVRAEFLLNGNRRVTEWSGQYNAPNRKFRPWRERRGLPALETSDSDGWYPLQVVEPAQQSFYRFKTPCAGETLLTEAT